MGLDPGDVPVSVELPEYHLGGVQGPEAVDDLLPGGLQVQRAQAGRWLHGDLGGHLEKVGDQHVEHRARGVVELRPVADVKRLWHVDLH